MSVLQARLDAAFAAHPERRNLGDFRAPPELARGLTPADGVILVPSDDPAALVEALTAPAS